MADRAHLTPVTTTDRRGRTTTVYRNLDRPATATGAQWLPPAPAIPAPGGETAGAGPLRTPSERPVAEIAEFLERLNVFATNKMIRVGRRAVALAMDFVEDGTLDEDTARQLIAQGRPEDGTTLCADALRTASVLAPRAEELGTAEDHWAGRVIRAVNGGYRRHGRGWDREPITKREQLDICVALTEFILRFSGEPRLVGRISRRGKGDAREEWEFVGNGHLDQLLRERPHDAARIIAYVEEHGASGMDDEDVHALRAWIEDGIDAPLGSGWL